MKVYGYCEKCNGQLIEGKAILTGSSKLFKGTNKYLVCNHCGAVGLYNESLETIFNIDRHKDNESVIAELTNLLQELDMEIVEQKEEYINEDDILYSNEEAKETPKEHELSNCSGSCATCPGCSSFCDEDDDEGDYYEEVPEVEEVFNYEKYIFVHNKVSGDVSLLAKDDISILGDISKYDFFILDPVAVRPVTTYEIVKK